MQELDGVLAPTGLRFVEVEHEGNTQSSTSSPVSGILRSIVVPWLAKMSFGCEIGWLGWAPRVSCWSWRR